METTDPNQNDIFKVNWDYLKFNKAVYFIDYSNQYIKNKDDILDIEKYGGEFYERNIGGRHSKLWKKNGNILEIIYPGYYDDGYQFGSIFIPYLMNKKYQDKLTQYVNYFFGKSILSSNNKTYEELIMIHDLQLKGKSQRDIAKKLMGDEEVILNWEPDSGVRANIRYKIKKCKKIIDRGYLKLLTD